MAIIKTISGSLFDSNAQIICHQCNCIGVMGSGVAAEVKKRYPNVYSEYRAAYKEKRLNLGEVIFSETENAKHQIIANMCGQYNVGYSKKLTDYPAVQECLHKVVKYIFGNSVNEQKLYMYAQICGKDRITIAFPYGMGSVRGGGDWNTVYSLIEDTFRNVNVDIEIWKL